MPGVQQERRRKQGFEYIELDNPDAYSLAEVLGAIELAEQHGLKVVAKNPALMQDDPLPYVAHRNVHGIIVEKDAGNPHDMHMLRRRAGKADLPVWFVFFDRADGHGAARKAAKETAAYARHYVNMSVTYSPDGEYTSAIDD